MSSSSSSSSVVVPLEDAFLQQFAAPSVDVAAFTSQRIRQESVESTLEQLGRGFATIDASIKQEVSAHETALLDQTAHIATLEEALRTVRQGVDRIEVATAAVASSIQSPLQVLTAGVVQLERLQQSCQLLRLTLHFATLVRRLEKHLERGQIPQAARILVELEPLEASSLLVGVAVVDALRPAVEAARTNVRAKASTMLMDGMVSQAQQEVTSALLTFAALGALREKIRTAVSISSNRARRIVDAGVGLEEDPANAWASFEATASELHELCLSVWHLQHVLVRAKDPTSGKTLWTVAGLEQTVTEPFWIQLAAKFSGALALPARRSLHQDYPRMYRLLVDFCRKVMLSYEMQQLGPPHRIEEDKALIFLLRPLAAVFQAHISRAQRRFSKGLLALLGPEKSMGEVGNSNSNSNSGSSNSNNKKKTSSAAVAPQVVDGAKMNAFCKTLIRELVDCRDAPPIAAAVAEQVLGVVASAASGVRSRMEKRASELSVATQTPAHLANASYCNMMLAVEGAIKSVVFSLGMDYQHDVNLAKAVTICAEVQREICNPLAAAIKSNITAAHVFRSAVLPLYHASRIIQEALEDRVIAELVDAFISGSSRKPIGSDEALGALISQGKVLEERCAQLSCGGEQAQQSARKLKSFQMLLSTKPASDAMSSLAAETVALLGVHSFNVVVSLGGPSWQQQMADSWDNVRQIMPQLDSHPYKALLTELFKKATEL